MRTHKRNRQPHIAPAQTFAAPADQGPAPERQRRFGGQRDARHGNESHYEPFSADSQRPAALLRRARLSPSAWSPAFVVLVLGLLFLLLGRNAWTQDPPHTGITANNSLPAAANVEPFDPTAFTLKMSLVAGLILVNAFFAIAEVALITVRRTRIRQLVEEENRSAILVEKLLAHPTQLMATVQTGITLIGTLSAALAATSAEAPLAAWFHQHLPVVGAYASSLALIVVTLPVAVLTLVIGEIAPKSLAVRNPERFALLAVRPINALQVVLAPIVALLTFLSNLVVRPFGGTASFTTPAVNEEEFKMMVEASEEQGVLHADETEMIHSILDFGDTVVRKVMTPRIDLTAFDVDGAMPELVQLVTKSGHSRIPVYEGDLDNIVGIIYAKDLLELPIDETRASIPIRSMMRAPYFIPEIKKIAELLKEFRRSRQQMAVVRDEYGVTAGLVTIEDLLEEIVGDIQDEYDREEPMVQVLDSTTSILDGLMPIHSVNDRMGLELPEDEADTIGGFVFGLLGHQAQQGERVVWENTTFVVEATDGRRVTKVRLIQSPEPLAPPDSLNSVYAEEAVDGGNTLPPQAMLRQ